MFFIIKIITPDSMLSPFFDCSSVGTRRLKRVGGSHNLKFNGIQAVSPCGSFLILGTDSSRPNEPTVGVSESTNS